MDGDREKKLAAELEPEELGVEEPLLVPEGPMTRIRAKQLRNALSGLIQELMAKENMEKSIGDDIYQVQLTLSLIQVHEGPN